MADKNEIHTEAISALSSFGSRAPSEEEAEEFIDSLTVFDEAVSDEIKDALDELDNNKEIKEAFGEETIKSYLKLKKIEINNFNKEEKFDKKKSITVWEKKNTLDC